MQVVLFECPKVRQALLPLAYTRAVPDFRIGILTLQEKWAQYTRKPPHILCAADYLQPAYACDLGTDNVFVMAHVCPDKPFFKALTSLAPWEGLFYEQSLLAARLPKLEGKILPDHLTTQVRKQRHLKAAPRLLSSLYNLLDWHSEEITADMALLGCLETHLPQKQQLRIYGKHPVFISPRAHFHELTCNTEQGPIYIGEDVKIEEGTLLQGPCALGKGTHVNMGAKLRAGTSIGPCCKVGGELSHSIFFSYSNKAHDGFIGTSVIGSGCNLGAGTSCSNLKNTYGNVSLWNYEKQAYLSTGRQFCGLFMGDYVKSAIHQAFNTGTVLGPFSNIFGSNFPPRHIPAFSWGGTEGLETYRLAEAIESTRRMMKRRKQTLSEGQIRIFSHIFEETKPLRISHRSTQIP